MVKNGINGAKGETLKISPEKVLVLFPEIWNSRGDLSLGWGMRFLRLAFSVLNLLKLWHLSRSIVACEKLRITFKALR